jgi:hypothetical protein
MAPSPTDSTQRAIAISTYAASNHWLYAKPLSITEPRERQTGTPSIPRLARHTYRCVPDRDRNLPVANHAISPPDLLSGSEGARGASRIWPCARYAAVPPTSVRRSGPMNGTPSPGSVIRHQPPVQRGTPRSTRTERKTWHSGRGEREFSGGGALHGAEASLGRDSAEFRSRRLLYTTPSWPLYHCLHVLHLLRVST